MLPARRRLSSQPQFTPRKIFAAMQGAWLEPPTGMVQLGSELIVDGGFSNTSNWDKGTGFSVTGGIAVANASPVGNPIGQSITTQSGKVYAVSVDVLSLTAGEFFLFLSSATSGNISTTGHHVRYITSATSAVNAVRIQAASTLTATFDNLSVRETLSPAVPVAWVENTGVTPVSAPTQTVGKLADISGWGNHATQATAANRPTYQLDANNLPLIRHDTTDYLTVSLPNLGGGVFSASGSVYFATPQGMSALHNQSMGTTYNLPAPSTDVYAWCVTPARLNAAQEAQLERYFIRQAGIVTPNYMTDENGNILTDDLDIPLLAG